MGTGEDFQQAVHNLCFATSAEQRQQADAWLDQFRQSPDAWEVCLTTLRRPDAAKELLMFSAQTLNTTLQQSKSASRFVDVNTKIESLLLVVRLHVADRTISTQLSMALAFLLLTTPAPADSIRGAMARFHADSARGLACQIGLLALLPEMCHSRSLPHQFRSLGKLGAAAVQKPMLETLVRALCVYRHARAHTRVVCACLHAHSCVCVREAQRARRRVLRSKCRSCDVF